MTFDEILEQVITLLKRQGRISYSALRRRFDLDEAYLEDLKDELLFTYPVVDEGGRGVVWTSEVDVKPSQPDQAEPQPTSQQDQLARAESPPAEPPTPDAERRQLTVMFCDLVDSSRLAGQLDPEKLREVIRAYQECAAGVIHQYEGHIAQYLGDGLLVYFGWPRAHEDDTQRAVHTGLGIVEAVDDLNVTLKTAYGAQLAVRLGIHTGPVVVGEMGSGDRYESLATGETVNIAARLEGLAEPNTVVISDDSRRLVAGVFEYDELGAPVLKGISKSIRVFRVRGLSAATSRFEATTAMLTPMVGREVEVGLLMRCWEQSLKGEGQVVLLNGPPGIGKSRLLQALGACVADTPHVHLRYQCSPYHTNSAFYPIAMQVTRAMQLSSDATSDAKLERLEVLVAQLGAAIGREFAYALLRAVSPLSDTELQESLGQLLDAGLISQRGLVPESIYTFKHALIQDAAYASMLLRTRQQVHQQIAQVLESQFPETVETQPELVAHHYTEADCLQEAAVYWQRAGERASASSAYVEAVAHFQKGLDTLQPLPETTERAERELALQLGLGSSLIVTQGWTAPLVEHAYVRAYELCQQLREPPTLIPVLQGLRRLYALRGDRDASHKAQDLGEQLLTLAQRQDDPVLLQEAHWALGQTLFYLGELNDTWRHLEQSSAAYMPQSLVSQASRDQAGTQIACLFYTGMALWMLGYPDQALRASHDGLALAQDLSHPFTLAFAFEEVAMIHQFRREVQATRQQTEAMIALASEQGFPVFAPVGTLLRAWTQTIEGEPQEAMTQIQQAMATLRADIDNSDWALHYARLAEAYGAVGQAEEGLRSVAEALELVEKTGFRFYEPELHRVQGELLLQRTGSDASQAETCFLQSLDIARQQQAKSWELRAATSLARLWQSQDKRQAAYELLQPVYDWFTEGFDTADLKEAKALLQELEG